MLTYDTLGRRISQADPDMGTWQYSYDAVGNLTQKTDNRNIMTSYLYDELDRKTKIDYPNDVDTVYAYDGNGKVGTLTSIVDTAGILNYTYDNRLRKIAESRSIDGTTWTTQFTYDAVDRVVSKTNPDSEVSTYTHNAQGEVNSVSGILSDIDYNAQNKITKKIFVNGLTTNYTYNTTDFRLSNSKTGTLQDMSYTYDSIGNVTNVIDNLLSKTQTFDYDDLDRLVTASESAGYIHEYTYNAIGNLTKFVKDGTTIDYTYGQNAGVHAVTSSTENLQTPTPTPVITATPTPTQAPSEIELLTNTWTLAGNDGSDEEDKQIPADSLVGKTSVQVTFNLHGTSFGGGNDEASVVFVQNGDWRAANVIVAGGQNGLNGSQTVTIPMSSFHKVGDTSILLDPNQNVSNLHARFWNSGSFSVDITSVKVQ